MSHDGLDRRYIAVSLKKDFSDVAYITAGFAIGGLDGIQRVSGLDMDDSLMFAIDDTAKADAIKEAIEKLDVVAEASFPPLRGLPGIDPSHKIW